MINNTCEETLGRKSYTQKEQKVDIVFHPWIFHGEYLP
jgi:hypothetical protein